MQPIAYVHSPYRQKFAIPRQPLLVPAAVGDIRFMPEFADANLLRGIEGFSHVWLLFIFHATAAAGWTATVTPPRLKGLERVGVLASRSPYRPNSIGLSAVEVVKVIQHAGTLSLRVRGLDLLDGTPILDIKPYLPYTDSIATAQGGYAASTPAATAANCLAVTFSELAEQQLQAINFQVCDLRRFITEVVQQDPRPAQHVRQQATREYGMHLYDFNVRWQVSNSSAEVVSVEQVDEGALPWKA